MKKTILLLFILLSLIACKEKQLEETECLTCKDSVVTRVYGPDSSITIYNVLTPNNYNMCDSFVYSSRIGAYVEPYLVYPNLKLCTEAEKIELQKQGKNICPCVKNKDNIYYDKINHEFKIIGIEKFPYNELKISRDDDTTNLQTYINYGGKCSCDYFKGIYFEDCHFKENCIPNTIELTGRFLYKLKLYKDSDHTKMIDEIEGGVTIIRIPQDCPTKGCVGLDANDPLLIK